MSMQGTISGDMYVDGRCHLWRHTAFKHVLWDESSKRTMHWFIYNICNDMDHSNIRSTVTYSFKHVLWHNASEHTRRLWIYNDMRHSNVWSIMAYREAFEYMIYYDIPNIYIYIYIRTYSGPMDLQWHEAFEYMIYYVISYSIIDHTFECLMSLYNTFECMIYYGLPYSTIPSVVTHGIQTSIAR